MKKFLRILMWIVLGIIGIIVIAVTIMLNWQTISNFKIGLMMDKFTEVTTPWTDIEFTTAVKGETPYIGVYDNKPYNALEKYQINGISGIKGIVLVYGSNFREFGDIDYAYKNEQAYIFRSEDNGKTFDKICLGHGAAGGSEHPLVYANNVLYIQIEEGDTKKIHYFSSEDFAKTWIKNDWIPTSSWKDGTLFIENSTDETATMSQDNGKTWHSLEGALKSFYDKTHSLRQLDDNTIVGMTKEKKLLFFNPRTNKEEVHKLSIPEGKVIGRFGTNNILNGAPAHYIELYDDVSKPDDEYAYFSTQSSIWFPLSDEHIQLPKNLPYRIYWDVKDNYIGGIFKYGDEIGGTPVHVYTLDHGKHWEYEILDKYSYMSAHAYIDGELWFVAAKGSAADVFLTKGKIE